MEYVYDTNCPKCGNKMICKLGTWSTLLFYSSPEGHDHDDNCKARLYVCTVCHHSIVISRQNRCPVKGCDWVGCETCFCHEGKKAKEWPPSYEEKKE